jgi:uncharacterized protein Yka (UPF0111/DUF47 family)
MQNKLVKLFHGNTILDINESMDDVLDDMDDIEDTYAIEDVEDLEFMGEFEDY